MLSTYLEFAVGIFHDISPPKFHLHSFVTIPSYVLILSKYPRLEYPNSSRILAPIVFVAFTHTRV